MKDRKSNSTMKFGVLQASDQMTAESENKVKQADMQVQYDALLEMFGQKVGEALDVLSFNSNHKSF